MKYSNKPRHYAPKNTNGGLKNKNQPGGRSRTGFSLSRPNAIAGIVAAIFGKLPRRTRRVFLQQQAQLSKQHAATR